MKKQILMLALMMSVFGSFAQTKNEMNLTIISVHTRVFGKDDLFKSRIDRKESDTWNNMVSAVNTFVINNKADSKMKKTLNNATNFANELLNVNKIIYSSLFYDKKPKSKKMVQNAAKQLQELQKKKTTLVKESDALKKGRFFGVKKNAVEVLNNFILVLELTTDKLINDFNKALKRITIK